MSGSPGLLARRTPRRAGDLRRADCHHRALAESPNGYTGVVASTQLPPTPLPLIRVMMAAVWLFPCRRSRGRLAGTIQEQELKDAGIPKAETVPKGGKASARG